MWALCFSKLWAFSMITFQLFWTNEKIKCFRSFCARSRRYLVDHPPDWNLKWSWMTDRPFSVGSEYKLSYIKTSNTILPRARTYEGQVQSLASKVLNVLFERPTENLFAKLEIRPDLLLNYEVVLKKWNWCFYDCSTKMARSLFGIGDE